MINGGNNIMIMIINVMTIMDDNNIMITIIDDNNIMITIIDGNIIIMIIDDNIMIMINGGNNIMIMVINVIITVICTLFSIRQYYSIETKGLQHQDSR